MLSPVVEDVDERVPDLSGRPELPRMVAVRPHPGAAAQQPVHRARQADREALQPADERRVRIGLHEEVHVIRLNAEVEHAEGSAGSICERRAYHLEDSSFAEREKTAARPQRHVHRDARIVSVSTSVRNGAPTGGRLAAGSATTAAPGPKGEIQLSGVSHLIRADII